MNVIPLFSPETSLERDISLARERMHSCYRAGSTALARAWFACLKTLIESRTPSRVAAMEREKGLTHA